MKKLGWTLLALALTSLLLVLLVLSFNYSVVRSDGPIPGDWYTDNEDPCCPGDWDTTFIYSSWGHITRTAVEVYEGNYSYEHAAYGGSTSFAHTQLRCVEPMTTGVLDAQIMFTQDPGHGGADEYTFVVIGWPGLGYAYNGEVDIRFNFFTKRAYVICDLCEPIRTWWLGTIRNYEWMNYRMEWTLPVAPGLGSLKVWMDGTLWVDETGITMSAPGGPPTWGRYNPIAAAGIGPWAWNGVWGSGSAAFPIYVDDVQIYPCDEPWPDPTPTPAPPQGTCGQYGHAAVLNVDDDCSAVLRFRAIPNYVPHDAVVTRATLYLYGVSVEQVGATINIAPLVPVWGEMTCDWCRRTVGEDWADPGATNIPLDRFPGKVAEFTAELGWVEVDIPAYIIEEWALTSASNPGLVLSNDALTGKYGIASREWIDADYRPYMVVYYTE